MLEKKAAPAAAPVLDTPPPVTNAILESTVVTEVKPAPADNKKAQDDAEARKALRA
jgi:hypothetical protein